MHRTIAGLGGRIVFALLVFVLLAAAIGSRPTKRLNDFDQSFYLTIAYDLDRHGVFSNGVFDGVDSTASVPPPGMFFAPLYPWLVVAALHADARFARAVECAVASNHGRRDGATCDIYARPIHLIHALLLALGVLAVARTAEVLFGGRPVFFLAGALAAAGVAMEAELLSYIMTESLTFCLFGATGLAFVLGLKTGRRRHLAGAGLLLGLLCLTRPSFLVLAPALAALVLLRRWLAPAGDEPPGMRGVAAFLLAFLLVLAPWLARNALSVGKLGLTEEYGAAALVERFAYDDMTAREFLLAFAYCVPRAGPAVIERVFGRDAMARFDWRERGGFFEQGRSRRLALTSRHGRLDPVIGDVVRGELQQNGWRYLATTVPLAWCGLWVGDIWGLLLVPLFAWACVAAGRRGRPLFLLYAAPALLMVVVHGAAANHYSRYNLGLIGPVAAGAAWMAVRALAAAQARGAAPQRA